MRWVVPVTLALALCATPSCCKAARRVRTTRCWRTGFCRPRPCLRTIRRPTPRSGSARSSTSTRGSPPTTRSAARTCHDPRTGWANPHPTDTGIRGPGRRPQLGHHHQLGLHALPVLGRARRLARGAGARPDPQPDRDGRDARERGAQAERDSRATRSSSSPSSARDVTTDGIAKAIAAFERSIVSGPSPYDRCSWRDEHAMSPAAVRGHAPLQRQGALHALPQRAAVLRPGVPQPRRRHGPAQSPISAASSRPKDPADRGRFKTPTLRNIALTPPVPAQRLREDAAWTW